MNRFKGTPAPWETLTETELELPSGIIKKRGKSIAYTLKKEVGAEQANANAHLIASAPELLEVLIEMQRNGRKQGWDDKYESSMEKTRLVIAKALGEIK